MEDTDRRMRLLEILRLRGGQTIADLVRALRMSRNAVRNLLMRLQAEGLVRPQGLRPGKRRPSVVYGLAPDAEALFPKAYDAFALALLEALREHNGQTLREVLDQVADRWIARDRPRVMQHHGEERLRVVRELLSERGFMPVLVQADGAYEIREHNCPLSRLVSEHPEVCDAVHRWLAGLVEAEVVRVRCMARGDPYSVYRVSLSAPR
jgi:predicted ArsR family transcriptional regulator